MFLSYCLFLCIAKLSNQFGKEMGILKKVGDSDDKVNKKPLKLDSRGFKKY